MPHFERNQFIPRSTEALWEFYSGFGSLQQMAPDILESEILSRNLKPTDLGQKIKYRIEFLPRIKREWVTKIVESVENHYFLEKQISGPYRYWHHLHNLEPRDNGTWITDRVHFKMRTGLLGSWVYHCFVRQRLEAIFDFRSSYMEEKFGATPAVKSGAL